jgi:hypothetical protein
MAPKTRLTSILALMTPRAAHATSAVLCRAPRVFRPRDFQRHLTTHNSAHSQPPAPPARWLADLRSRLGKCIIFGCSPTQVQRAAGVLRVLATEWRALTAGSEGFLTGARRGLEGQAVVWGEMDSFVSRNVYLL